MRRSWRAASVIAASCAALGLGLAACGSSSPSASSGNSGSSTTAGNSGNSGSGNSGNTGSASSGNTGSGTTFTASGFTSVLPSGWTDVTSSEQAKNTSSDYTIVAALESPDQKGAIVCDKFSTAADPSTFDQHLNGSTSSSTGVSADAIQDVTVAGESGRSLTFTGTGSSGATKRDHSVIVNHNGTTYLFVYGTDPSLFDAGNQTFTDFLNHVSWT